MIRLTLGRTRRGGDVLPGRSLLVGGPHEIEEVRMLRLVELERPAHAIEHLFGDAAPIAALEARVVLDADARQQRDLFAPQPLDATRSPVRRQPRARRGQPGAAGGEELADLLVGVHDSRTVRRTVHREGGTASTRKTRAFLEAGGRRTMRP